MRALLDVNVLIALLDVDHSLHVRARNWFAASGGRDWASCPLTQNGCVRIMTHAAYPNGMTVHAVIERLAEATAAPGHAFWPDSVSLLDRAIADASRIHGPRQLTDLYLLALAVRHDGRFVTFDRSVALDAIHGAHPRHLFLL